MEKLISIDWSVYLGYHIVKKILPFGFQFKVEKWRSYGGLDLDPGEMDFILASNHVETLKK